MSIHINAQKGDIAETVLLPGDPLRAKYVADNFLENVKQHNEVRGMLGFTGTYRSHSVSVQGTGMGIPSISIYVHELLAEHKPRNLIRIGTCGSIQANMKVKDVILAMSASTDSHINKLRFQGMDYAPSASFSLLHTAYQQAAQQGLSIKVGGILSTDQFYHDDPDYWKLWANYGILAIEMETSALYTLAAKFKVDALSILTVSDNILTGDIASTDERERSLNQMIELALETSVGA